MTGMRSVLRGRTEDSYDRKDGETNQILYLIDKETPSRRRRFEEIRARSLRYHRRTGPFTMVYGLAAIPNSFQHAAHR